MISLGDPAGKLAVTYRFEKFRAVATGVLESGANTFLLLIAVSWFHAGPSAKALIPAATSTGFLLSPILVSIAAGLGARPAHAAAVLFRIAALAYAVAALSDSLDLFLFGTVIGLISTSVSIPLVTQLFHENYPREIRGRLYSRTLMVRILVTVAFSYLAGQLLSGQLQYFGVLIAIFALAAFACSACLARCPSEPRPVSEDHHIFRGLAFARSDKLFRATLVSWMILGFANLMAAPLRIEWLANPAYGLNLSVESIALYVAVIPNLARLLLSPLWGMLFDRLNFFAMRILVNLGFAVGIGSFFTMNSELGLLIGSIAYGVANAGGEIAWGLWVTKIAPPQHVTDYMAAHTFLTGVRGVIAPLIGFWGATFLTPYAVGVVSVVMILIASALLIPEFGSLKVRTEEHGRPPL